MEGEFFPFWRDITNNQIISSSKDCKPGKIPQDTIFCTFSLYNGKLGTKEPITTLTIPCVNTDTFDSTLLKARNAPSAKVIGRSSIQLASRITK